MLSDILAILNFVLFLVLAGLHIYWAFGGKKGLENAVPAEFVSRFTSASTRNTYSLATIVVAFGLISFGIISLLNSSLFNLGILKSLLFYTTVAVACIFLIRAIGDFKHVGFFKKEKVGKFAHWDTRLYSPLCLYLGLSLLYMTMK